MLILQSCVRTEWPVKKRKGKGKKKATSRLRSDFLLKSDECAAEIVCFFGQRQQRWGKVASPLVFISNIIFGRQTLGEYININFSDMELVTDKERRGAIS